MTIELVTDPWTKTRIHTMNDELSRAVTTLTERLLRLAAQDDGLMEDLRALGLAILTAIDRASPRSTSEPSRPDLVEQDLSPISPLPTPIEEEPSPSSAVPEVSVPRPALPELTFGRSRPAEGPALSPSPALPVGLLEGSKRVTPDADLLAVEACCRLKAEGLRWAATRRRLKEEGAEHRLEIAPRDREILDRAGHIGCYLWMSTPDFAVPDDPSTVEEVAGCFDAVADGLTLVRAMLPDQEANRRFFEPALDLLAEAQSALRVAIDGIDGPGDPDQFRVYDWLRGVAAREQIYIRRYMRLDDPADPSLLSDIEARIEALDTNFQDVRGRAKRRKSALNRLRYHAKQIADRHGGEHDWRKVAGAVEEMIDEGMPASNVEVREVLLPILDVMPDLENLPDGFGLALREVDRYLAARMSPREVTNPASEPPTPDVAEAARLLEGKDVVMIGGSRRPEAHEALKLALGLKELVWIETREHESIEKFEPSIARAEVALVLLAIRWSSHSFGDVKRFCDRYGKLMVRLPGGYGVNQVAAQILAQCGRRLGDD